MRQIPSVLLLMLSSLTNKVSKGTGRDDHSSEPYGTGWDIGAVLPNWMILRLIFSDFSKELLDFKSAVQYMEYVIYLLKSLILRTTMTKVGKVSVLTPLLRST